MELTGKQQEHLTQILLSAFPRRAALAQMVRYGLDLNLDGIAGSTNLADTMFELIEWARARNRLADLLTAAVAANPGHPDLRAFAHQMGVSAPAPEIANPTPGVAPAARRRAPASRPASTPPPRAASAVTVRKSTPRKAAAHPLPAVEGWDLKVGNKLITRQPDDAAIASAIRQVATGEPFDFAILSRGALTYMQSATFDRPGEAYILEYQDGGRDRHYRCPDFSLTTADIIRVFTLYLHDDPRWLTEYAWEKEDY